jgi:alpha-galactosidase
VAPRSLHEGNCGTPRILERTRTVVFSVTSGKTAARYYMNRNFFVSDPDAFAVSRNPMVADASITQSEAEVALVLAAASGGMFDIGGDITELSSEPENLALTQNRDVLQMARLSRAAVPIDLMSYSEADEMPSQFVLREDKRQTMVAVFNWTGSVRSHSLSLESLHLPSAGVFQLSDALHPENEVALIDGALQLRNQQPHSVRLIRVIDTSVPAKSPRIDIKTPPEPKIGTVAAYSAEPNLTGLLQSRTHGILEMV